MPWLPYRAATPRDAASSVTLPVTQCHSASMPRLRLRLCSLRFVASGEHGAGDIGNRGARQPDWRRAQSANERQLQIGRSFPLLTCRTACADLAKPPARSAHRLGAIAGDEAVADHRAVDREEEHAGEHEIDNGERAADRQAIPRKA